MTDARMLFSAAVDLVTEQVDALAPDDWTRPSPCAGWDARQVLVHVTGTVRKVEQMLTDGTYLGIPSEVDEAPEPEEAVRRWRTAAARAKESVAEADLHAVVDTPRGEAPAAVGLALPTSDCAVHAWDIGVSAGRDVEVPPDLIAVTESLAQGIPEEQLRSRFFGPELPAPEGASETERLMAWLGRARP